MATRKTASGAIMALVVLSGMVAGCRVEGTQTSGKQPNPAATVMAKNGSGKSGSGKSGAAQSGTEASGAAAASAYTPPPLDWESCTDLPKPAASQSPLDPAFQCAKLKVPLDYTKPYGDTIDIALIRLPGTGPASTRVGSLLINPGGPGASGVDFLARNSSLYQSLRARYDLVSFDPRGVTRSAPVKCETDAKALSNDSTPDTPQEEQALLTDRSTFMRACQTSSARILPYVGTVNAARDMEVMRTALGDRYLHYFGVSYGTWLGGVYAHQFPSRVGRMVLDGAMNTRLDTERQNLQQAAGFQLALSNYAEWETTQPTAGGATKERILARIAEFVQELDTKPIKTGDKTPPVTQDVAESAITTALYSKQEWPSLTKGLQDAFDGDGSGLLTLAGASFGSRQEDHFTNESIANMAVTCDDTTKRYAVADVKAALPEFTRVSPVFGPSMAWGLLGCQGWPSKGNNAAQEVSAPSSAMTILVVGNTGDPATPYRWASDLAVALGSGRVLTYRGQGHSSYIMGNACTIGAVDAYFLHGEVPAPGTVCG